ncbi:DUF5919 domain-containing protein [Catelliglobosispora koreensis]|uniref:DUF5919 domain-containing protein n=1 Tax=Catelliglobosispora koreensis TaxID=129052 RepID=UPI00036C8407|nr:DUF5919 domain-containing protein [Catelliglobosispora koreensis]
MGVDQKTVERWITKDRVPHRAHRLAAAQLLGVEETYLWPGATNDARVLSAGRAELADFFPSRSAVPPELWRSLIDGAEDVVDVLVFAGQFLPEVHDVYRLAERARDGCRVRLLLGDPRGKAARARGEEEGVGLGLVHRIVLTLRYYAPILAVKGIELRLHDTTLYASIYRCDDTMLVNTHAYGAAAAQNPVLHLRRVPEGRVFSHYCTSFDRVWVNAVPVTDVDTVIASFDKLEG